MPWLQVEIGENDNPERAIYQFTNYERQTKVLEEVQSPDLTNLCWPVQLPRNLAGRGELETRLPSNETHSPRVLGPRGVAPGQWVVKPGKNAQAQAVLTRACKVDAGYSNAMDMQARRRRYFESQSDFRKRMESAKFTTIRRSAALTEPTALHLVSGRTEMGEQDCVLIKHLLV